jgi:hypothetical protein
MASQIENENRIFFLERQLAEQERKTVEARTLTAAQEAASLSARDADAKITAAKVYYEACRRGSWVNHLLAATAPDQHIDFVEVDRLIPAEGFPPGVDESTFALSIEPKKQNEAELSATSMGSLLNRGRH